MCCIMSQSPEQLFDRLHPAIALFADVWGVSVPMATALCQDGVSVMVDRLVCQTAPYRLKQSTLALLKKPLTPSTFGRLRQYALPQAFFGRRALDGWHARHPDAPVEQTLCFVGFVVLLLLHHQGVLCVGQPMIVSTQPLIKKPKLTLTDNQKAWGCVAVFLAGLGLVIWQSLPEPPPKPITPPKTHQKIPDVAIVRIDDNQD